MAEYIDRAAVLEKLKRIKSKEPLLQTCWVELLLTHQKTADLVEVKRGEWVTHRTSKRLPMVLYKCSVCGYERIGKANFCEDCGADMRPLNAVKE